MSYLSRRNLLKGVLVTAVSISLMPLKHSNAHIKNIGENIMPNLLPLPYAKDALEPHISQKTLSFHYDKHHAGYVNNLNKLLQGTKFQNESSLEKIITQSYDNHEYSGIFNNAAQVWNHTFYWNSMKANGIEKPQDELSHYIDKSFGNFDNCIAEFSKAAQTQFGSGWAWLVLTSDKQSLQIIKTPNAISPLVYNVTPLLTIDVWEHAYYLDYQNLRPKYVEIFFTKLVNWNFALRNLRNALHKI